MKAKLVDVFGDVLTDGGLFVKLNALPVPWIQDDISADILDTEYFYNYSGQKTISPLLRRYLNGAEKITDSQMVSLANIIYKIYIKNWNKLYTTLSLKYNPISNYDMTETETIENESTNSRSNTGTQTVADTGTKTTANTGTQTETDTGTQANSGSQNVNTTTTGSGENDVFGFNSVNAVGDSTTSTSASNTTTSTDSNTRTDNLTHQRTDALSQLETDNLTHQRTDNLSESGSGTDSTERTLTRSGNIGVTTSQQMIESERDLWRWKFFFDVVFPDIDEVLTVATYHR